LAALLVGNSNKTTLKFEGAAATSNPATGGRNFHFGVREHQWAHR
jgi:transketolase